eukprot:6916129-Lingulodinium_polyedra.AAC.1
MNCPRAGHNPISQPVLHNNRHQKLQVYQALRHIEIQPACPFGKEAKGAPCIPAQRHLNIEALGAQHPLL